MLVMVEYITVQYVSSNVRACNLRLDTVVNSSGFIFVVCFKILVNILPWTQYSGPCTSFYTRLQPNFGRLTFQRTTPDAARQCGLKTCLVAVIGLGMQEM
jgi:hypothetical protein